MDDTFYIFITDLPDGINEMMTPCFDGFTIYINNRLDEIGRLKAYYHAVSHILQKDFDKDDVQIIESGAHGSG